VVGKAVQFPPLHSALRIPAYGGPDVEESSVVDQRDPTIERAITKARKEAEE
jgi:hypothetical protein